MFMMTAESAAGKATKEEEKCAVANTTPKDEFCIPTSMDIALLCLSLKPPIAAVVYPTTKPAQCSKKTDSITTPISPENRPPFPYDASAIVDLSRTKFSENTLHARSDEVKTARRGAKGVTNLTTDGNALCIEEPNRIGATTT
jgi:hypothetical protein